MLAGRDLVPCRSPGLCKPVPEVPPVLDLLAAFPRCSGLTACMGCGTTTCPLAVVRALEGRMGAETAKALRARQRESRAHIDRQIAKAEERSPLGSVRQTRIAESTRLARRRLKALATAQQAAAAIEVEIGRALLRVVEQGLSRNEAFELAGVSRHLGRRYLAVAESARASAPTSFSTDPVAPAHPEFGRRDPGTDGTRSGAAIPEGNA